jgi:hypothetical protein
MKENLIAIPVIDFKYFDLDRVVLDIIAFLMLTGKITGKEKDYASKKRDKLFHGERDAGKGII